MGQGVSLPGVPPAKITAPAEAARPIQTVATSGLMYFIVSYIANREVIDPPGELIYTYISFSGSSDSNVIIEP